MKTKIISLLTLLSASVLLADSITVAIPDFVNMTADHVTRIAPGKYKEENVKVGEDRRAERYEEDGKSIETRTSRDVYEKQLERFVEYAPGDWALPNKSGTIAADSLAGRLIESKIKVLSRNTQTIRSREEERLFTTVTSSPNELIDLYRDLNADYIVIGRIAGFRIDETSGSAYGVNLRRAETRVSGDIQVVDVATGEIAAQRPFNETISRNIPSGLSTTTVSDWELPLRIAIERVAPSVIEQLLADNVPATTGAEKIIIDINSTPAGADILVGDLFVGNTPAKIALEVGRCDVRIEKQGFQPWSRQVKVQDDLKINVTLNETPPAPKRQEDEKK